MLAMFLSALEQTIVAPALPAIGRSLGGIDDLAWVVTAYLLAATATTPLFGKLSDIYGRRAVMLTAILVFIVGSVACAVAPSIWVLIFARALQGIGGGGLLPLAQTVIGDLLSPRERPAMMGYTAIMFVVASSLGPVLGGLLTDHLHWSLIFWINLPLGLLALATTDRALRKLPRHDRKHQLDMLGAVTMVAASLSVMLALAWGGVHYPWGSWQIFSLFVASAALWCLFALRLLSAREPFIPLAILNGRVTGAIICAAFFAVGTIIGVTIYTPLYCQTVLGISASQSGLILIAFMVGTTICFADHRAADGPSEALHAHSDAEPDAVYHRARPACRQSGGIFMAGIRAASVRARHGARPDVSDEHAGDAEFREAASDGDCDGHA